MKTQHRSNMITMLFRGVNQAGLQQFSNFKPPIVLENPGIQFYISRVLEKKKKKNNELLENTENSLNFCSHRK